MTRIYPWAFLGLTDQASVSDVRRAYARLLKETRPEDDATRFQYLVEARDLALLLASTRVSSDLVPKHDLDVREALETARLENSHEPLLQHVLPTEEARKSVIGVEAFNRPDYATIEARLRHQEALLSNTTRDGRFGWFKNNFDVKLWERIVSEIGRLSFEERRRIEPLVLRACWQIMRASPKKSYGKSLQVPKDPAACKVLREIECEYDWVSVNRSIYLTFQDLEVSESFFQNLAIISDRFSAKEIKKRKKPVRREVDTRARWRAIFIQTMTMLFIVILLNLLRGISPSTDFNAPDQKAKTYSQIDVIQAQGIFENSKVKIDGFDLLQPPDVMEFWPGEPFFGQDLDVLRRSLAERQPRPITPVWYADVLSFGKRLGIRGLKNKDRLYLEEAVGIFRRLEKEWLGIRSDVTATGPVYRVAFARHAADALRLKGDAQIALANLTKESLYLDEAIISYRESLALGAEENLSGQRSQINILLANALLLKSDRTGDDTSAHLALDMYNDSAREETREKAPLTWWVLRNNSAVGEVLLGHRLADRDRLKKAENIYLEMRFEITLRKLPFPKDFAFPKYQSIVEILKKFPK